MTTYWPTCPLGYLYCPACWKRLEKEGGLMHTPAPGEKCDSCGKVAIAPEGAAQPGEVFSPPLGPSDRERAVARMRRKFARFGRDGGAGTAQECADRPLLIEKYEIGRAEPVGVVEIGGPAWCCGACLSLGPFRDITYPSTPDGPEEHDMACKECGSTNICESFEQAARAIAERLDTVAAALKVLALTPATRDWLRANDPKALEQASFALSGL